MARLTLADDRDFIVYREGSGGTVEIVDIAVNSERRKGHGKELVYAVFAANPTAKRVWAITRADNFVAQQFYEALHFRAVPLRDFYGNGGIDAVMYIRDLECQT